MARKAKEKDIAQPQFLSGPLGLRPQQAPERTIYSAEGGAMYRYEGGQWTELPRQG